MSVSAIPSLDLDRFDAVIFDLDGVVTKTARVHALAWKKLFDQYLQIRAVQSKRPFQPFDLITDYRSYVDGKPRNDGVKSFLESRGISLAYGDASDGYEEETICGLGNRKNMFFLQALQQSGVETFSSTIALARELKSLGIKTAIVTASKNCHDVLSAAGLVDMFDVKVDGHDACRFGLNGKPAPDGFLKAAELLNISPQRVAIFEDAQAGVQAGRAGNFGLVVGIDRVGHANALKANGADLVIPDVVDLAISSRKNGFRRNVQALPFGLEHHEAIFPAIKKKLLAVFLDYDGTLTPIVQRPELATLPEETRTILQELAQFCMVAIISGRDRLDVQQLVKLDSLIYAGSHGFDISGPSNWHIQHEQGTQCLPTLNQAESFLRDQLAWIQGTLIERKRFSIAVHYRLVEEQNVKTIRDTVEAVQATLPQLRITEGKKVYELQPAIGWNKGKALLWVLDAMRLSSQHVVPLFVGDDQTDEEAFQVLQGVGVGIVVDDHSRFTYAQYRLNHPEEVTQFLSHLTTYLRETVS